jgi:hypothetical protein
VAIAVQDIGRALFRAKVPVTGRVQYPDAQNDQEAINLLDQISTRKLAIDPEQAAFAMLCERWDNLYYPQGFTAGGASHWSQHATAKVPGKAHVSVNVYPTYVNVPAALQSVPPVENMLATGTEESDRLVAAMVERLYTSWKRSVDLDVLFHQAMVVKGLYGRTASKVYWDDEKGQPVVEIVDQPKNLYLGWRDSNYKSLEWALYTYQITPQTALEDWGLYVDSYEEKDPTTGLIKTYPYVVHPAVGASVFGGTWMQNMVSADLRVEVYDYWYRRPAKNAKVRFGKPTKFETWNAIFVGNVLVKNDRHPEYKGRMPYLPLFNDYIPGMAEGRPELYDIEQLVREKDERMSGNAQMIGRAIDGQMWQLTGAEAPLEVPSGLRPTPNNIVGPGPGNRIEPIAPWMPEFQLEAYLSRIDRDLTDVSGLNDLLRGMAPAQVLSSGKAIASLTANYEMRIMMKRDLAYAWRRDNWQLAEVIWSVKNKELAPILDGKAYLDILPPSLTPRDDLETANLAMTLKEGKLFSFRRAMDKVGVDDPETELDMIRAEQTDATLNPASVQVMVTLMATLQQLGMQMQQLQQMGQQGQMGGPPAPGQPSAEAGAAALRAQGGVPPGSQELNAPEEQAPVPAEQLPANAEGGGVPGPNGPSQMLSQFQVQEGEASGRLVGQSTIQRNE